MSTHGPQHDGCTRAGRFPRGTAAFRGWGFVRRIRFPLGQLLSVVFPTSCPACDELLGEVFPPGLCAACHSRLQAWRGALCDSCGIPLASAMADSSPGWRCGECRAGAFRFDYARAYGIYADPLRKLILQVKFRRRARLGVRLGQLLEDAWKPLAERFPEGPPLLAPVPLHRSRERERDFNQAELLARGFWRTLNRTGQPAPPRLEAHLLRRTRPTPPQSGLSRNARLQNVRGSFEVADPSLVRGRSVILVDDVMTTGATASACAGALKRSGAEKVIVLTLARATPQFPDGVDFANSAGGAASRELTERSV